MEMSRRDPHLLPKAVLAVVCIPLITSLEENKTPPSIHLKGVCYFRAGYGVIRGGLIAEQKYVLVAGHK